MKDALVIAVHPDDETLGCGGTLLRLKAEGYNIHWVIVTSVKEEDGFKKDRIASRAEEIQTVAKAYGCKVYEMGFSTAKLDQLTTSHLVTAFSELMTGIRPSVVFLPFYGDVHSDHRLVFEAVFSCTKTFRYPFLKEVLMMETLSETDFAPALAGYAFVPNVFVDITAYLEKKLEIMAVFKSEVAPPPFPRSFENMRALATLRGGQAGALYAEAFMLLKQIR